MGEYTLTEEEKRHIEEKIRYEEEVKERLQREKENTTSHEVGFETKLSPEQLQIILPNLEKAKEILAGVAKQNNAAASLHMKAARTLSAGEQKKKKPLLLMAFFQFIHFLFLALTPYGAPFLSIGERFIDDVNTMMIYLVIVSLIIGSIWLMLIGKLIRSIKKKSIESDAALDTDRAFKLRDEATACYEQHKPLFSFLPQKYQNAECCKHIIDAFKTGRASSFREAFEACERKLTEKYGADYTIDEDGFLICKADSNKDGYI